MRCQHVGPVAVTDMRFRWAVVPVKEISGNDVLRRRKTSAFPEGALWRMYVWTICAGQWPLIRFACRRNVSVVAAGDSKQESSRYQPSDYDLHSLFLMQVTCSAIDGAADPPVFRPAMC